MNLITHSKSCTKKLSKKFQLITLRKKILNSPLKKSQLSKLLKIDKQLAKLDQ